MSQDDLASFAHQPLVVKVGGELIAAKAQLAALARDVATLARAGVQVTLVHGGGPQLAARLEAKGLVQAKVDGLRPTSAPAVGEVRDVLCNEVNPTVVAALGAAGAPAAGLCGASDGILRASRLPPAKVDYGHVGNVDKVAVAELAAQAGGKVAVLAPVAVSADGEVLNVNADEAARAVASALGARLLVFVTDTDGIRSHDGTTLGLLDQEAVELLKADGVITGGMLPKVNAALAALEAGVAGCRIINGSRSSALLAALATADDHQTSIVLEAPEDTI